MSRRCRSCTRAPFYDMATQSWIVAERTSSPKAGCSCDVCRWASVKGTDLGTVDTAVETALAIAEYEETFKAVV